MDRGEDPLESLRRELRESVGDEFRRSSEEDEAAARKLLLSRRTLADVALELVSRGDTVQLNVGAERFVGVITYARGSLATLETSSGDVVHVNLAGPIAIRVTKRSTSGGRSPDELGPDSFEARLRELEHDEQMVVLAMPIIGEAFPCRIEAVAADHALVLDRTGQEWFVPLHQVATATRRN